MTQQQRTLPADVYDALELSALAAGGIGQPEAWRDEDGVETPCCILGQMRWAAGCENPGERTEHESALFIVGIGGVASDTAVRQINTRRGKEPKTRVTFAQWCRELNITRGN